MYIDTIFEEGTYSYLWHPYWEQPIVTQGQTFINTKNLGGTPQINVKIEQL